MPSIDQDIHCGLFKVEDSKNEIEVVNNKTFDLMCHTFPQPSPMDS